MTPESIITPEEIERVHANANFGAVPMREVVNQALLKCACGYSNGHTAQTIITEHGLVVATNRRGLHALTTRGRKYLWAAFGDMKF